MKRVKFIKAHAPYKVGDIAGFNEGDTEKLMKMGVVSIDEEVKVEVKVEKKSMDQPPVDKMIKRPKTKK